MRRVVVTGIGLICAVGNTTEEAWKNLLAGKSGVAMDQHGQDRGAGVDVAQLPLLGARLAQHDGIGRFEMGRVCGQRQMHVAAIEGAVGGRAQMIFDSRCSPVCESR